MLEELNGKTVLIHMGTASGVTDTVKGEIIKTDDAWLKVQTKKKVEFIRIEHIKRIVV